MKKHFLEVLFFSIVSTVNINGQLTNGLKAYYPFNGDVNDHSGQSHNGRIIGNPTLTTDRFGMENCAYLFPGNKMTYINVHYHSDFDVSPQGAFSISLWFQGGSPLIGDYEELFQKGDPSNNNNYGYTLALYDLNQVVFGNGLLGVWSTTRNFQYPDTNWYNLIAIYDNKKWFLYKDTILQESNVSGKYFINQANNSISIGRNFLGKIDDIRFYNRALNTNEINQIFNLSSSCQITESEDFQGKSLINIYPNPSNSKFTVSLKNSNDIIIISVYDLLGVELIKYSFNCDNPTIDLSKFKDGFYIINIFGKGLSERRIIEKY